MVLATVFFALSVQNSGCLKVKRWKTAEKDDDRKTINRKSSWSTKKSAPESESSVIGAVITNSFSSSNTCSRLNKSSSSKFVTCIDDIMNILVNIKKEQRSRRKDTRTLRTSVDEIYNYDNNADYFGVEETRVNETEIETNNNIRSSD